MTLRLWYHESCRVFADRLINDADRNKFAEILESQMSERFRLSYPQLFPALQPEATNVASSSGEGHSSHAAPADAGPPTLLYGDFLYAICS